MMISKADPMKTAGRDNVNLVEPGLPGEEERKIF